ncbi:organic cation transporter-like protein isoform X2 [Bicyclus anynana]|uniref:Organic cation transporter-like protein isoform X2 n=1 Tax=Bicyclus anynana TaxID=110368 RepID=A0A6J1P949_BICAN|nr:organic cation transporter-like protein isoform X2 [Bicyclus anynana]
MELQIKEDNRGTNGPIESAASAPTQDLIQKATGSFGKYQLCLCLLIFLSKFPVAFHQMAIIFLSPKVEYTCGNSLSTTCPCPEPVYNTSLFTNTIIMQWDLICDKKWLTSFTQTLFQLGTLLGSVLFGMASDRFGRKKPLLVAVVLQVSSGITAAYMPDYWTFTFIRLLVGMSVGGTMVIGFVIVMEFVGTKYRDIISALYQTPFNLGHMLLPVFGYYFRDYSKFQLAISLPTIILLSYIFLVPETARWLIAVKRTDEAVHVLERVAKVNNLPTQNIRRDVELYQESLEKSQLKKGSLLDLFKTPNLRKNICAMSFNWLTCSYCFYGVSQYVGQLSGNVFFNVAASASVTLLGTLLAIPLIRLIGRKTILIIFNFICASCLFILAIIPEGHGASVVFASIGVVASFINFVLVYLYCTELFPTVVRNAAIGFSSMMARVGSMLAPFIIELKDVAAWMPPVGFAVFPLVAAFVSFLLPETKGCELMTTIEEGEQFGKKKTTADNKN